MQSDVKIIKEKQIHPQHSLLKWFSIEKKEDKYTLNLNV